MAQKMEDTITSIQVIFDCQYQISPKNKYGPNNAEILLIIFLFIACNIPIIKHSNILIHMI